MRASPVVLAAVVALAAVAAAAADPLSDSNANNNVEATLAAAATAAAAAELRARHARAAEAHEALAESLHPSSAFESSSLLSALPQTTPPAPGPAAAAARARRAAATARARAAGAPEPALAQLNNDRRQGGGGSSFPALDVATWSAWDDAWGEAQAADGFGYPSQVRGAVQMTSPGNFTRSSLRYVGADVGDETRFQIASISKTFTAVAALQLVDSGDLDLNEDINEYLPEGAKLKAPQLRSDGGEDTVTLHDCLTHTAGFEEFVTAQLPPNPDMLQPLEDFLARAKPRQVFPRATVPSYSNYAYSLVGLVVQEVSGKPLFEYFEDHIFGPLGMTNTFLVDGDSKNDKVKVDTLAPAGVWQAAYKDSKVPLVDPGFFQFTPAGSIWSTGPDMLTFAEMLLGDGANPNRNSPTTQILSTASAQLMRTPHWGSPIGTGYGLYSYYMNNMTAWLHDGDMPTFSSRLLLIPEQGFAVFISTGAGRAPAREELFNDMADNFFPAREKPTDLAPAEAKFDAGYFLNTRANWHSCMKLTFVFGATPWYVAPSSEGLSLDLGGVIATFTSWMDGFYWTDAKAKNAATAQALKDNDVNLTTLFDNYPLMNMSDDGNYFTTLASVNGLANETVVPPMSLGAMLACMIISLILVCCGSCAMCCSCIFRRNSHRDDVKAMDDARIGALANVREDVTIKVAWAINAVIGVCVLFGIPAFIAEIGTIVATGPTFWTGIVLFLPILLIIALIVGLPLGIFALIQGHWWLERRIVFLLINVGAIFAIAYNAYNNLVGYNCYH